MILHLVFSTIDATSGVLQLELDHDSSFPTSFAKPFRWYRLFRPPFGTSSAAEVFHRTISELLSDIDGVEVYVDDLLGHAPTKADLESALSTCAEVNLTLNLAKCKFVQATPKYLSHAIDGGMIKSDSARPAAIENMPMPTCSDDVQRLLGMATYLAKFCASLATTDKKACTVGM